MSSNTSISNIEIVKNVGRKDDCQGNILLCSGELPNGDKINFVSKIPKRVGFLSDHETQIIKDLNSLNLFHFPKYFGNGPKGELFMEYVTSDKKIKSIDYYLKKDFNLTMNLIKQTLMALYIAQNRIQFTHYDLHCDNILLKKVNDNSVFLYVIDDSNQFCVPTGGLCSVLIDFGYSHTSNTLKYGSLEFTDLGYTPNIFDPHIDAMRFLVTSSKIAERYSKPFRNIIKNIYPLSKFVSLSTGWFKKNQSILHAIRTKIICSSAASENKSIFYKKILQCLTIFQGLYVPNFEGDFSSLNNDYHRFTHDYDILTANLTPAEKLELLKIAIIKFTASPDSSSFVIEYKNNVIKFSEEILLHLDALRKSISAYITSATQVHIQQKNEIYSLIKLNIEQIFGALDFNFHSEFKFDINTTVYMWKDGVVTEFQVPGSEITELNKTSPPLRGTCLYDIWKQTTH